MNIKNIEKVKMPIIYISLSILLSSFCFGISDKYLWLAVLSASLFFIFVYFMTSSSFLVIIMAFFALGIFINYNYYNMPLDNEFKGSIKIIEDKSYYKIGEISGRKFQLEGKKFKADLGQIVYVEGTIKKEVNKEKGILGTIKVNNLGEIKDSITSTLYSIKEKIYSKIQKNLGSRKAALVSSLAFGYTEKIDEEDKNQMRELGIVHAISVSGLHVALVFSMVSHFLGKKLSLLAVFIYVVFTGAEASSLRAFAMIFILNLAVNCKKTYNSLAALSFSAMIFTIFKVYSIFNLGFILSYLATLGIILFSYKLENKFYKLPNNLRSTIAISLSAQVFTVPVMMACFNECSLSFLLGNLLLVPLLNLLIVLGNLLIIVMPLEIIFDFTSYIILKVINLLDFLTDVILDLNIGTYVVNSSIALIYCSIIISFYFYLKGRKKVIIMPVIAMITAMIYIYSPITRISYLKEGILLISCRGDRKIITNKTNIDMAKLKKITLASKGYRKINKVNIDNDFVIEEIGKNYLLTLSGEKYLLKVSKKDEGKRNYDIINFIDNANKGLFIYNNAIYIY